QRATREAFIREWRNQSGKEGEDRADLLFNKRRQLLEHLAYWQQQNNRGSLLDEAVGYANSQKWFLSGGGLDWSLQQMATLLQRTGLLIRRGNVETFLHESIQEYLAAASLAHVYSPKDLRAWAYVKRWRESDQQECIRLLLGIWSEQNQEVSGL